GTNESKVHKWCIEFRDIIKKWKQDFLTKKKLSLLETGDVPIPFSIDVLKDEQCFITASRAVENQRDITQHLAGLHLRIQEKLNDERWQFIFNYEEERFKDSWKDLEHWLKYIGLSEEPILDLPVTVFDCSMLGYDVLPFFCGVVGRLLLDSRQHVIPSERFYEPWIVILEEAHNYTFPYRQDESRGIKVSRETFERIAKEGRKFGLSLIIASQRPSDVSGTILSQCSNFIVHRLQNPTDIEHFREMVPAQSKRLLDQVTILSPGEALIFGSAVHVPSKVQVTCPNPPPQSDSSCPHLYWSKEYLEEKPFPLKKAISNWIGTDKTKEEHKNKESKNNNFNLSDDIPF
ncbi:MAG: ATP-binding protein, partial [Candidatus Heimdallarchaeaceae archaeon]